MCERVRFVHHFLAGDKAIGWGAFHEKDVTCYNGSFTEGGVSKNGTVGIYNHDLLRWGDVECV